ncbi:unnamed protein product, partial [Cuscuta epithymum]
MDWLGKYKARILCDEQKVILKGPNGKRISYKAITSKPSMKLMTMQQLRRHIRKGYETYLCFMKEVNTE